MGTLQRAEHARAERAFQLDRIRRMYRAADEWMEKRKTTMADPRETNLTRADAARAALDGGTVGLACAAAIVLATTLAATPAGAVTITPGANIAAPVPLELDAYTFANTGGVCGSGGSVAGDPCAPVIKTTTTVNNTGVIDNDGRGDGVNPWWDSNDIPNLRATLLFPHPVTGFVLGVRDENDQRNSFWTVTLGDVSYSAPPRVETNPSPIRFLTFLLDGSKSGVDLDFATRLNDGYQFEVSVPTSPIPLPATALLLLAGLGGLAMVRRARG